MAQLFIITSSTRPMSCRVPSGRPSPPSAYQSLTDSVFWKTTSLRRFRSIAATWALLCIMKLRPTWPEEFASPPGCASSAEASSSAAELTAPAASTNRPPRTVVVPSGPSATRWSTRRPERSVTIRRTRVPVARRRRVPASAGSMAQVSASLFAPEAAGEAVAGAAPDAAAGRAPVDAHRIGTGVHAECSEPVREVLDVRLVLERRVRVRRAAPGLGRVLAGSAVHAVDPLGLGVVGLEVGIAERPGGRGALVVLHRAEVVLPEPGQAGAVDLGAAADHVVDAGCERPAPTVVPGLCRLVPPLDEDRARRPVGRLAGQAFAALEHQHVDTSAGQRQCRGGTTHAGPDDDDVGAQVGHGNSQPSRRPRRPEVLDCRA